MSPNGTLLAYSTPANIKELRDQAALISMAWKDYEKAISSRQEDLSQTDDSAVGAQHKSLETLTIECDGNNLIVRAIQPKLLLVLVGGIPPGRKRGFKMTAEATGDPRYPSLSRPTAIQFLQSPRRPGHHHGKTRPREPAHLVRH